MTLFAEYVEETDGTALELRILDAELRQSLLDETTHLTCLRDAAQVALHVGHETWYASLTKSLGYDLQSDGLTRTCGTCNETVAICHLTSNRKRSVGAMGYVQPPFFVVHNAYSFVIFCKDTK